MRGHTISFHRNGGANQGWNLNWRSLPVPVPLFNPLTIQGVGSRRCIDIHNSDTATAGRDLLIFDCTGQPSQSWVAEQATNGQVLLRNGLRSDLCMDNDDPTRTADGGQLRVQPCSGGPSQEFMLTSFDPTGTPTPDQSDF